MENLLFEAYVLPLLLAPIFLAWGAERFVDGASALSLHLGVEPLMIGVLVMGFGTSLPELLVSMFASALGNAGLALGNAEVSLHALVSAYAALARGGLWKPLRWVVDAPGEQPD